MGGAHFVLKSWIILKLVGRRCCIVDAITMTALLTVAVGLFEE